MLKALKYTSIIMVLLIAAPSFAYLYFFSLLSMILYARDHFGPMGISLTLISCFFTTVFLVVLFVTKVYNKFFG